MRRQQRTARAGGPPRVRPPERAGLDPQVRMIASSGGTLSPSAMYALQQAAGNSAGEAVLARQSRAEPADRAAAGPGAAVATALRSPGRPLDSNVRTEMEASLGADFSGVRIHTDAAAHTSAQAVNAHAYTVGRDVVFQRGRYDTSSTGGRRRIAHELTHVVQQQAGPVPGTPTGDGLMVSDPNDRCEREAEATARRVVGVQRAAADGLGPTDRTGQEEHAEPATLDVAPTTPVPVVQRLIGFEFETGIETLAIQPPLMEDERTNQKFIKQFTTTGQWEPRRFGKPTSNSMGRGLRKKELLVEVPGLFMIEADEAITGGSDLEFVTEPFPESDDGRDRMLLAISRMIAVANSLVHGNGVVTAQEIARAAGGSPRYPSDKPPGQIIQNLREDPEYVAKTFGSPTITASPQTSVGIRLDRIPQLLQAMAPQGGPQGRGVQSYDLAGGDTAAGGPVLPSASGAVHAALNNYLLPAVGSFTPAPPSGELRGLLTLIATYLIGGARSGSKPYVKGIAPILARTDFATVFAQLPEYQRLRQDRATFVSLAMACAGLQPQDATDPVYGADIGPDPAGGPPRANIAHITRADWLNGMIDGHDVLSQTGYNAQHPGDPRTGAEFESMGSFNRMDPAGALQGPILELRRMAKGVPHTEWQRLAILVFDLVRQINT